MIRVSVFLLAGLGFATSGLRADESPKPADKKADEKQPAFVAEFLAIKKGVDAKRNVFYAAIEQEYDAAKTEDEREAIQKRFMREVDKILEPAVASVMNLVRPHAAETAAVEALVWVATMSREPDLGNEAAGLLTKHHAVHKLTIDMVCRYSRAPTKWTEPLLRVQLAAQDLPKADRPRVLYALAVKKQTECKLLGMLSTMTDEQLSQIEGIYGKMTAADIRKIDIAAVETEAIELFVELGEKHGSEKFRDGVAFDKVAKSSVFEIRHLSLGKIAPDISGEDIDGMKFKLSDYRGRVVMLSFWFSGCDPCIGQVPHEREILARHKDKPFAIIGVNADSDRAKLKATVEKVGITWRSFWCGKKGLESELLVAWNIQSWPTTYLLDQNGVIRAKNVYGKELDRVIDKLVNEVDGKK